MTLTLFSQNQLIEIQQLLELHPSELLQTGRLYKALECAESIDSESGLAGAGNSIVARVQCLLDEYESLSLKLNELRSQSRTAIKEVEVDKDFRVALDSTLAANSEKSISLELDAIKRKIRRAIGYVPSARIPFVWNDGRIW